MKTNAMKADHAANTEPVAGLEARYFTDKDIYKRVEENIFYKTWQFACHASQTSPTSSATYGVSG